MDSARDQAAADLGPDIPERVWPRWLLCLFLLGLAVRVGYLVEHARNPSFGVLTLDQKYYSNVAHMLLSGEDLHKLQGLKPLLYPMFLAEFYKIGGEAHGVDLALAAQHLFGVLTGLIVALIGARLFRHRASGLAGGVLYLLAPVPLCFEGEALVESTYTFLICLGLLLCLRAADSSGGKGACLWALCGAVTVLAAQERPNIMVFLAVYPMLAGWRWWKSRKAAVLLPLLGLAGALLMGVPWGFVNKMQSGRFQILAATGGINLYMGNRPFSDAVTLTVDRHYDYNLRYEDPIEVWSREGYVEAMRAEGRRPESDPMAASRYWTGRAINEIKAAPAGWLRLMAKKCWLMLWNTEVPNNKSFAFLQTQFFWLRLLPVRWVVLLMFAPAGLWAAWKWGNRDALLIMAAFSFLYAAAIIAFFICDRYRYPLWPAMAIFAGGGLLLLVARILRQDWRGAIWPLAAMSVAALVSMPNWYHAQLPSFALDYRLQSIAWYESGHFPQALEDIDHSLRLDPSDPSSWHQRGNVLIALDRLEDARKDFEKTLSMTDTSAGIWNNYAVVLDGLGKTNEAMAAYRRAIECKPPSESAFIGLAFEQIRRGRPDDAAATLDQYEKVQEVPDAALPAIRSCLARWRGDGARADALAGQARLIDKNTADWALSRAEHLARQR